MNRRTFLKCLGLAAASPVIIAKAAEKATAHKLIKWVDDTHDDLLDAQSAFARAYAKAMNREKDRIILEAFHNCDHKNMAYVA